MKSPRVDTRRTALIPQIPSSSAEAPPNDPDIRRIIQDTLDTYGHLMEALSKHQAEWIDKLVFPEGWEAALKLHLDGAPERTSGCSPVQSAEAAEPFGK